MTWWLIIGAVVAAALGYGYWDHTKESRHLARLFARLAEKHGGASTGGSFLALPRLRFEMDDRRYFVSAMASSGAIGPVRGPFTFVEVELPFDTGQTLHLERGMSVQQAVDRLVDTVTPGTQATTGDKDFDSAFGIKGGDQALISALLGATVRHKLLASQLPRPEVRLNGQKIGVHMDGIAGSKAELEEMIEIAALLAAHCPMSV